MSTGPYGPIVTGRGVCRQALSVLQRWLPGALAEIARQEDYPNPLEPVHSWDVLADPDQATQDQLPAVFVVSDGTVGVERRARGIHDIAWNLHGHVILRGQTHEETAALVAMYTAAIRTVLLQRSSLDGFAEATSFVAEDYDTKPAAGQSTRTLGGGAVEIVVFVKGAFDASGGPDVPPGAAEPGPWPTVTEINADVDNVPLIEELTA